MKWTCHPATSFPQWSAAWDAINERGPRLPFFDSRFITAALRWFGDPGAKLVIGASRDTPLAMGFFVPRRGGVWDTWQPSQLPLGAWVSRPDVPLAGAHQGVLKALPGYPLALGLTQLDPDITPRAQFGAAHTLDYVPTAVVNIAGSFDDYWAARGKNLRHNIKRQQARLATDGVHTQLEVIESSDEVAASIAQYGALEGSSWKANLGTALQPDNAQGRFYREVLERLAPDGQTRIYRYRFDDNVVAMHLCIAMGDALVILKTTCRDDLQGFSPAVLMHREIFASLFAEQRFSRVEFFGRVMEWHTRWTEEARMLYHANIYRHAWLPRLRAMVSGVRTRMAPA